MCEPKHDGSTTTGNPSSGCDSMASSSGGLFFRFAFSGVLTTIFAGMILDGGEVSKPSIIGAWIVSLVVFVVVLSRRGEAKATKMDRLAVVLAPPMAFAFFMCALPLVWRWRELLWGCSGGVGQVIGDIRKVV